MGIKMRKCEQKDLQQIREISIETFTDTFSAQNSPEQLHAYLKQAYDEKKLQRELADPDSSFYFIYRDEELAGYLKLNIEEAQSEPLGTETLEVERIYVRSLYKRNGLGKHLIQYAMETAKNLHKEKIWLGVWEKNERALAFYRKLGFIQTGSHSFYMGEEEQTDLIMTKTLV